MAGERKFVSLDLVPPHWHRRDRCRRHAVTIVCVGAALCTAVAGYGYVVSRRADRVSQKLDEVSALTSDVRRSRAVNQLLQQRIEEVDGAADRLAQFSNTRAWRQLMLRTAELTDDTLVLTRVACLRPKGVARRPAKNAAKDAIDETPQHVTIDLEGIAVDQEALNRFIQGLDATGAFSSVQLMWTRRQKVDQAEGFGFALRCDWEETS